MRFDILNVIVNLVQRNGHDDTFTSPNFILIFLILMAMVMNTIITTGFLRKVFEQFLNGRNAALMRVS